MIPFTFLIKLINAMSMPKMSVMNKSNLIELKNLILIRFNLKQR